MHRRPIRTTDRQLWYTYTERERESISSAMTVDSWGPDKTRINSEGMRVARRGNQLEQQFICLQVLQIGPNE